MQTNGKAVASMVLGILALFFLIIPYVNIISIILGIVGIVLSKKAFNEIRLYNQGGRGMAIAGLTTSIIALSIMVLIILFVILVFVFFASTYPYFY